MSNPPQVDTTLERVAEELRSSGDYLKREWNCQITGERLYELAAVISAHARRSQSAAVPSMEEELAEALRGLIGGTIQEVNEKGGGGFALARLSDARAVLARFTARKEGGK